MAFNLGALAGLGQFADYLQRKQQSDRLAEAFALEREERQRELRSENLAWSGAEGLAALASGGSQQSSGMPTGDTMLPSTPPGGSNLVPGGMSPPRSSGGTHEVPPTASGYSSGLITLLTSLGVSPDVAAGAATYAPSNEATNPIDLNPTSGAIGWNQWLGPRKSALLSEYGPSPSTEQQIDFTGQELRGPESKTLSDLRAAASLPPDQQKKAGYDIWGRDFERPGDAALRKAGVGIGRGVPNLAGNQPAPSNAPPEATKLASDVGSTIDPSIWGRTSMKAMVNAIDKAAPDAEPAVKFMALERLQKLMAPDERVRTQMLMLQMKEQFSDYEKTRSIDAANFRTQLALENRPGTIVQQDGKTYRIGAPGSQPEEIHFPGTGPVTRVSGGGAGTPPDPKTVDFMANGIANYKLAPLSGWAMRSPFGQQVMAKVMQIAPDYDQTKYQQKQRTEIAGTTGRQGDAVRSFSVALSHLSVMDQVAVALANDDIQTINRLSNAIQKEFGYSGPVDFNFVKSIVGDEIAKAVIGGVGSVTDRQQLQQGFEIANSPEQLAGVALRAKQLMAGQIAGLRRQLTSGGMSEADFEKMLSPEAKEELGGQSDSIGAPVTAPNVGSHPQVPPSLQGKPGLQWSPSQKMWRDSAGALYGADGAPVP